MTNMNALFSVIPHSEPIVDVMFANSRSRDKFGNANALSAKKWLCRVVFEKGDREVQLTNLKRGEVLTKAKAAGATDDQLSSLMYQMADQASIFLQVP